jgi:hypothetical protein
MEKTKLASYFALSTWNSEKREFFDRKAKKPSNPLDASYNPTIIYRFPDFDFDFLSFPPDYTLVFFL